MQPIFASCAKIAQTIFKTTLPNRNLRLFICNLFSMRFSTSRNRFYLQSVREISHCRRPGRYSRHILFPRTSKSTRHSYPKWTKLFHRVIVVTFFRPVTGQIVVLVFPYSSLFLSKSIITPYPIYGIIEKTMTYLSIPDVFPCPKKSDNNLSGNWRRAVCK